MPFSPLPARLPDGRKSVGRRPLTPAEQAALISRYRRNRAMKIVWVLALVFVPIGFFSLLASLPMGPKSGSRFLLFLAGIAIIGWVAISAWEALKGVPALEVSATATEVEIFEDGPGGVITEVIANSGEVYSVDGRRSKKLRYVEVISPAYPASTVAKPGESRSLDAEERSDLKRKLQAVRRDAGKHLYLPSFSMFLGILFVTLSKARAPQLVLGILFMGSAGVSLAKGFKILATGRQIARDLREGKVQGVDRREVLPHSQLDWTTNGFPASWRNSPHQSEE